MAKPTHKDAELMLQLVRSWPIEATDFLWSDEFVADPGELATSLDGQAVANIRAVLNMYETIGTLHKHDLLNEDLLFDWLAIDLTWDRVKGYALAWRAEIGNPHMYENFEAMASAQRTWAVARDGKTE